ncbi:hypothetical protein FYK98_09755 [Lactobacillus salivarius]|nr:hypothetical protein [Ligilactobacillus salivarius]
MNQFNKDIIAVLSSDKDITLNEVLRRQIEVALDRFIMTQLLLDSVLENQSQLKLEDRLYDTDLDQLFHN